MLCSGGVVNQSGDLCCSVVCFGEEIVNVLEDVGVAGRAADMEWLLVWLKYRLRLVL